MKAFTFVILTCSVPRKNPPAQTRGTKQLQCASTKEKKNFAWEIIATKNNTESLIEN